MNALALKADTERAQNRLNLQQQIDPELAKLRTLSKEQLLQQSQENRPGQIEQQLYKENFTADPRLEALKSELINRAQDDISKGATLPPEFQAELVRSGLSHGAASGFALDPHTIGGSTAHAIGSAGIQLQAQRQAEAGNAIDQAQKITDARTNILANIFPKVEAFRQASSAGGLAVADQNLPEAGLGGQDVANLEIARTQAQGKLIGQQGQVDAQRAASQGQFVSGLIGAGTSAVNAGVGAFSGAGGSSAIANPNYGAAPGSVDYNYAGDPGALVKQKYLYTR